MCTAINGKKNYSSTRPGGPSPASALEATIQGGTNQNCGIMFFVFLFTGFKSYFLWCSSFLKVLSCVYGFICFYMVWSGLKWSYLGLHGCIWF